MKKLIALFLVLTLALGFAACGSKEETAEDVETEEVVEEITEETTEETEDVVEEEIVEEELTEEPEMEHDNELPLVTPDGEILDIETGNVAETPVETTATLMVLQNIWMQYAEDEKFAVMGGNPEAGVMDAPGSYDMAYAENLGFQLVIPAEQMANVTEAATLIHMMNANTFSCGAVKLADGVDAAAFAQAVRDALQSNQWICGFPETLVIADVDGCVLIAFGVNDAMTPFQANLTKAYADAQILFNEAIAG